MTERLQAPRGTYDVLPEHAVARAAVERAARGVLEPAGYRRIETPAFEHTELFSRGVGESTDIVQKEMFTFDDRGGRSLTLRPEGTAPVARAYLEHGMHKLPQPVRVWYLGAFFRNERPQAGRFKQFWQIGAEAIGSDDPAVDAELVALLQALLDTLEVRGVQLRINSLGTPASRAVYREQLAGHLRAHEDQLSEDVRLRIDLNPLRAFDSDHPGTQAVMTSAPLLADVLDDADREHFAAVRELLDAAGVAYEVDPTLVRGLDYYTRTIFEFTSGDLGAQSAVGGGGRYDGLAEQLGGPPTPGCGWAAGIERMLLAAEPRPEPEPVCDLFVAWEPDCRAQAFELVTRARGAGLGAQMDLAGRSRKGQLKQAGRLGARYVALLAPEGAALKDMELGEQQDVDAGAIVARVINGRHLA
ncbi:MAG TPA: histidine--tRNA ligase [Baekduia sp.]|nr:histidine--tRNA ligase [Baekduia sp.]